MFHSACSASSKPAASPTRGSVDSPAIIASMRLISAVWSATTSDVNPKSTESWAAPGWRSRFSTMVTAPRWCLIHQLEEEPVERDALRPGEARHLVGRQHPRHGLEALGVVRVDGGDVLAALAQPVLHHLDLVLLRELDAPGGRPHGVAGRVRVEQRGHLEGLGVVRDHALHEPHVGLGEPDAREVGGLGGRDGPARLAGRARLHDGGLRVG